jgi:hypothetical protein
MAIRGCDPDKENSCFNFFLEQRGQVRHVGRVTSRMRADVTAAPTSRSMSKPRKRVAFIDADSYQVDMILNLVADRYDFELTQDRDADFVFHSIAGYDVLKYPGVRIFLTGENVTPNFAISDYAMAFEKLQFRDRYIWFPLIKLYRRAYASLKAPRPPVEQVVAEKTSFCAYVMSNTKDSAPERIQIFDALSKYKQVNSGGRWRNNTGGRVPDKLEFQSKHKFVIAFENTSWPGYLTEKFAEAAEANAVPIYWGDPEAGHIFNPKAFINCHNFSSFEAVVEEVKRIDQSDALFRQMLAEPWFPGGIEPACLRDEVFVAFLSNILDQGLPSAFRRNRGRWGLKMEQRLYTMSHRPMMHAINRFRHRWRRAWRVLRQ